MNPTINIMPEDIRGLPYINNVTFDNLVKENIQIATNKIGIHLKRLGSLRNNR